MALMINSILTYTINHRDLKMLGNITFSIADFWVSQEAIHVNLREDDGIRKSWILEVLSVIF